MNIIFLDFDGVLNSTRSHVAQLEQLKPAIRPLGRSALPTICVKCGEDWREEFEDRQWADLDLIAIGLVDQLCKEAPAKVCISSTWRIGTPFPIFEWRFRNLGFKNIQVFGRTPDISTGHRGTEIQQWVVQAIQDGHQIDNFVILDDDSDMLAHQMSSFVHVSNNNGFLLEHYRNALRILNPAHSSLKQFEHIS